MKHPKRFLQVSYEQYHKEPIPTFRSLFEFTFDVKVQEIAIKEALKYYDFQKQKAREWQFTQDESKHFHFMGKESYRDMIEEHLYRELCCKLDDGLTCKFGYSLSP